MQIKNSFSEYGAVARSFHWLMALLIITLLAVGLYMTGLENTPDKFKLYGLHKATGIVVLFLVAARLGWKVLNVSPLLPAHMDKYARFLAHAGHVALYGFMFAMPLSGWLMSSAVGFPVSVYGLFVMPNLVAPDKELADILKQAHEYMAWGLMAMIAMHFLAALLHHFYYKDTILTRMLPFSKGSRYAQDSDINTGC